MTITEGMIALLAREPQASLQQQRGATAGWTDMLTGDR
jgi:hypothetical protein